MLFTHPSTLDLLPREGVPATARIWPGALFMVLLMVFSVVMTMLGNSGATSVGYAVLLGTTAARLTK
ncbi:hypothetical protein H4696_006464 [Amycolatopsis lexingtonensis]|uniref:Uncharacterized protein n=1 Tax=Amycolatopsis lexingtonensis TaxID=218822 RepID=A0ABR9I862_9PSEU|nr:hypothetical protein [Amycolatopsis lexingtonensis]MBE1499364.1 hypothetical protein [Amycolatopsis lexingtonensis]